MLLKIQQDNYPCPTKLNDAISAEVKRICGDPPDLSKFTREDLEEIRKEQITCAEHVKATIYNWQLQPSRTEH